MAKKGLLRDAGLVKALGIVQGWTAIGRCIGRSGKTARRWHDRYFLPVHHSPSGRPFAFVYEIEKYMEIYDGEWRKDGLAVVQERQRQHAAMMRKRKAALRTLQTFGIGGDIRSGRTS